MYHNFNKGFSLIELSIVLVIIGLITAAITSGTNLIRSAKATAIINEIGEYRQAVNSFLILEDRFPGDIKRTGKMGYGAGYTYSVGNFGAPYDGTDPVHGAPIRPEIGPFVELYLAKIIDFEPKNTNNTTGHAQPHIALGKNGAVPRSKREKSLMIYYQYYNSGNSNLYDKNLHGNLLTFNPTDSFIVDPKLIRTIDQKIDDGSNSNGIVRGNCNGNNGSFSYDYAIQNNLKCAWFFIRLWD